jgi:hypothetical protein
MMRRVVRLRWASFKRPIALRCLDEPRRASRVLLMPR